MLNKIKNRFVLLALYVVASSRLLYLYGCGLLNHQDYRYEVFIETILCGALLFSKGLVAVLIFAIVWVLLAYFEGLDKYTLQKIGVWGMFLVGGVAQFLCLLGPRNDLR